ncbi:type II toxin-antitoxin system Phd/YefM family antitoxin [Nocardioides lacusdianchii]|uniref:type II toxin-antitoxin system Phd/YefM family antitoxin n=1 Tax=Nocardioides lacusdianchii TaxID=2783664 RepID=UPI001CCA93D6|nr:type II toxin-antitoxin system prevent-host-death family antitoxin [Nocardioides lacusdianchii]
MRTVSYVESQARFAELLNTAVDDREEVVVTRDGRESVVIGSLAKFDLLRETAHLTRSPANARRLLDAIERLENGTSDRHGLKTPTESAAG